VCKKAVKSKSRISSEKDLIASNTTAEEAAEIA
jgi:hypothetical protein